MYACSWLIYVYMYAINYANTICTDSRGFLTRFVRVYAFVCSCLSKVYCYVYCVQDIGGSQSLDWCVECANGWTPMAIDSGWNWYLFRFSLFYTRKERWENEESLCVCGLFLNVARVYRVLLHVCMCVFHTRVYATSRWCTFPLADH